ncbi:hypothetical protein HaLaN_00739 [Haematococcus lacustris]|uniref:Secreted protein n=1 Tax=Haematococcus lacustris TaxID=44745 RepID=A0A699Y7K7_HAELA|nr:hypothetical protein HaLaN_00739 [Haematococcus lacustris]
MLPLLPLSLLFLIVALSALGTSLASPSFFIGAHSTSCTDHPQRGYRSHGAPVIDTCANCQSHRATTTTAYTAVAEEVQELNLWQSTSLTFHHVLVCHASKRMHLPGAQHTVICHAMPRHEFPLHSTVSCCRGIALTVNNAQGQPQTSVCPGQSYGVQVSLAGGSSQLLLTSSLGQFSGLASSQFNDPWLVQHGHANAIVGLPHAQLVCGGLGQAECVSCVMASSRLTRPRMPNAKSWGVGPSASTRPIQ